MRILKNARGITLIALVVTIVVLLILAGVSISMLVGENGIINQAINAIELTETATLIEAIKLKALEKDFNSELDNLTYEQYLLREGIINDSGVIDIEKLNINISKGSGSWSKGDIYQLVDNEIYYFPYNFKDTDEKIFIAELWEGNYLKFNSEGQVVGVEKDENGKYLGPSNIIIPRELSQKKVTGIYDYAFYEIEEITSITIEADIETIGEYAFAGCTNLTEINLPESVTSIGQRAFRGCTKLTDITIPSLVTRIEEKTFGECTNLKNINLNNNISVIGIDAFYRCESLETIVLPTSLNAIEEQAFYKCLKLNNIHIPATVSTIGERAFAYDTNLSNVTIEGTPTIGLDAFKDCPFQP